MVSIRHHNNFNAVRLIAALMVVRGHMAEFTQTSSVLILGNSIHGTGVHILFLLGGYLITQSWYRDPNLIRYSLKRFFRLWPPLVFAVLFTSCVVGPLFTSLPMHEYFASPGFRAYFSALRFRINFFLPGVFEDNPYPNSVNGSLWTLPIEVMAYLVIAVLLLLLGRLSKTETRRKYATVAVAATTAMIYLLVEYNLIHVDWQFYGVSIRTAIPMLLCFLLGACYALVVPKASLNLTAAVCLFALLNCVVSNSPVYRCTRCCVCWYFRIWCFRLGCLKTSLPGYHSAILLTESICILSRYSNPLWRCACSMDGASQM